MVIVSFISGKIQYDAYKAAEKEVRRSDYYKQILMGREFVEERCLFAYTNEIDKQWFTLSEKARKIMFRAKLKNELKTYNITVITGIICFSMVSVLLSALLTGAMTIGVFISFANIAFQNVRNLTWELSDGTRNLSRCINYMKDVKFFYELEGDERVLSNAEPMVEDHCDVEFQNVTFRYPNTEKYILKDVTMKLENGCHYAFVGINGAGKTTLTKLLMGFYDEYEGNILINGRNIKTYKPSELKGMISTVFQDFARYGISLRDNIVLGDIENITDSTIISALKTVDLENTAESLPNGLDTVLGKISGDDDLSGGQWQRVAISRTLVRNVPLVILDEPTASLDPVAENEMFSLFDKVQKGRTTIFITHRLGSARFADKILVLDDGCIKEEGKHDELMALDGLYASMFLQQRSWYV